MMQLKEASHTPDLKTRLLSHITAEACDIILDAGYRNFEELGSLFAEKSKMSIREELGELQVGDTSCSTPCLCKR